MSESTPQSGQLVYDPTGVVETEQRPLATRVESLSGLRLGVLDNTKWNAGRLLKDTVALLEQEDETISFGEVNYYKKESFSKDASPELIEKIASENDLALVAIGD